MAFRVPSGSATIFCSTALVDKEAGGDAGDRRARGGGVRERRAEHLFVLFDKAPRAQERAERLRRRRPDLASRSTMPAQPPYGSNDIAS